MQQNRLDEAKIGFADKSRSLLSQLRDRVLDGSYKPGELIPEQALAEVFGVSRTPVREALKQLENEGLVEIRARVGTFVRYPTRREIIELFQVKEVLEGLAAYLTAQRKPSAELDQLKSNLRQADEAIASNDTETYARLVHEFHWTVMRAAQNQKLMDNYDRLMNQLTYHRLVLETVSVPGRLRQSNNEHAAVVEAIEAQDAIGAELAMRNHVHASSRVALSHPQHRYAEHEGEHHA